MWASVFLASHGGDFNVPLSRRWLVLELVKISAKAPLKKYWTSFIQLTDIAVSAREP